MGKQKLPAFWVEPQDMEPFLKLKVVAVFPIAISFKSPIDWVLHFIYENWLLIFIQVAFSICYFYFYQFLFISFSFHFLQ